MAQRDYPERDFVTLARSLFETVAETTNLSLVEPSSICRSDHPSCPLRIGMILFLGRFSSRAGTSPNP